MSRPAGRYAGRVAALLCIAAWVLATAIAPSSAQPPSGDDTAGPAAATGIDVSHKQGKIDWAQVAAEGRSFVFIKATEGEDWTDPEFASNWRAAKEAGLLRGAYHFFRPDDSGEAQAANFLSVVDLVQGDLPAVLDVETSGSVAPTNVVAKIRTWLEMIETRTGQKPILYTDRTFWTTLRTSAFGDYPLWIAEYEVLSPLLPPRLEEMDLLAAYGHGSRERRRDRGRREPLQRHARSAPRADSALVGRLRWWPARVLEPGRTGAGRPFVAVVPSVAHLSPRLVVALKSHTVR